MSTPADRGGHPGRKINAAWLRANTVDIPYGSSAKIPSEEINSMPMDERGPLIDQIHSHAYRSYKAYPDEPPTYSLSDDDTPAASRRKNK